MRSYVVFGLLPALAADHARRALLAADPALVEAAAARLAAAEASLPVVLGDLVRRALAGAEPTSSGGLG